MIHINTIIHLHDLQFQNLHHQHHYHDQDYHDQNDDYNDQEAHDHHFDDPDKDDADQDHFNKCSPTSQLGRPSSGNFLPSNTLPPSSHHYIQLFFPIFTILERRKNTQTPLSPKSLFSSIWKHQCYHKWFRVVQKLLEWPSMGYPLFLPSTCHHVILFKCFECLDPLSLTPFMNSSFPWWSFRRWRWYSRRAVGNCQGWSH